MLQTWDSWADISPKYVADRPVLERRTDPLSEVFGSMSIQEAVYMRLEATAPWGVRYLGDTGPRIRFMLVVRGSAFLRFCLVFYTCGLSKSEVMPSNASWIFWRQKPLSPV